MRSKKYLKLFILMIGIIFIGTNVVKADVQIDTNGGDYIEINARNYFNNCPLNIIKKVDTNGNVVFCADHDMPLPFSGNGTYTWTRSGTSAQSSAVAYIFENADDMSVNAKNVLLKAKSFDECSKKFSILSLDYQPKNETQSEAFETLKVLFGQKEAHSGQKSDGDIMTHKKIASDEKGNTSKGLLAMLKGNK